MLGIGVGVPFGRSSGDLAAAVAALFANGEQGGWYDPSDFSTLFQDSAGTTPVTTAGQPVGRMLDKSGRGNHLMQATAAARPVLQTEGGLWFLLPDGVDDRMTAAAFDPVQGAVMVCAGVRKLSDAAQQSVMAFNLGTVPGAWRLETPNAAASTNANFASGGTVLVSTVGAVGAAPQQMVLTGAASILDDAAVVRRNGTQLSGSVADQGTGAYLAGPLELFTRNGGFFSSSRFYGGIVRFALNFPSGAQLSTAEAWVNSKTGAY
jgi:hypothetical protein